MTHVLYICLIILCNLLHGPTVRTITFYTVADPGCNNITADGSRITDGNEPWCAVSRELRDEYPYGSIIFVAGEGFLAVHDTMSPRIRNTIDVLVEPGKAKGKYRRGVWTIWKFPGTK